MIYLTLLFKKVTISSPPSPSLLFAAHSHCRLLLAKQQQPRSPLSESGAYRLRNSAAPTSPSRSSRCAASGGWGKNICHPLTNSRRFSGWRFFIPPQLSLVRFHAGICVIVLSCLSMNQYVCLFYQCICSNYKSSSTNAGILLYMYVYIMLCSVCFYFVDGCSFLVFYRLLMFWLLKNVDIWIKHMRHVNGFNVVKTWGVINEAFSLGEP